METLDDVKVYVINKYVMRGVGNVFQQFDLTVKDVKSQKVEYFYVNDILFRCIEEVMKLYEPLLVFGTEDVKKRVGNYIELVEKWKESSSQYKEDVNNFVDEYEIDIKEVYEIVLKIVSKNMMIRDL